MDYSKKTIPQLKAICKERKIKGISRKNKTELIELLKKSDNPADSTPKNEAKKDVKVKSTIKIKMISKSERLSKKLSDMIKGGRRLNDDSSLSEDVLDSTIPEIKLYIEEKCKNIGGTLEHKETMTLFECQEYYQKCGGPTPNIKYKSVYMKPDGGIFIMHLKGNKIPILIIEDKVQGTNDILHAQKKKRQSTGNAIERAGKNIRGAEMIFANQDIFPYVIFASGCDFHSCETIPERIVMMNMGYPNHYIEITPTTTQDEIQEKIHTYLPDININKSYGKGIVSVWVKAHKWNEMAHGSSLWKKDERVIICKSIVDKVFESFITS